MTTVGLTFPEKKKSKKPETAEPEKSD